jgi:hypothetical protein
VEINLVGNLGGANHNYKCICIYPIFLEWEIRVSSKYFTRMKGIINHHVSHCNGTFSKIVQIIEEEGNDHIGK